MGRIARQKEDATGRIRLQLIGVELIAQIAEIYSIQGWETEILAASIRSPLHIVKCAEAGANVVTSPLESIMGLLKHPLTDIGLAKFLQDAKAWN